MISPKKKSPSRSGLLYSGPDLDSPSRQKIGLLADKWTTIESGIDKDKKEKKDTLSERVDILENVLTKERPRDDQKFKTVKDQILRVQERAIVNSTERENFDAKKEADLQTLQDAVSSGIGQERKVTYPAKQGSEVRLMAQTDERFTQLASIASKNKDAYNDRMNTKLNLARTQIGLIKSQIEGERKQREEGNDQLAQQIDAEIKSFQDQLLIEKKVREETQSKIFRMIEEIHTKLSADIQGEKKERATTVDALLKLLEDACIKVNQAFK